MDYQLEILLSTHNGEAFLSEQIDSLLSQSFTNWKLCIRDDGSTDGTQQIITHYVNLCSSKIVQYHDTLGCIGASQSFSELISHSRAQYIALCDQDDVWCSNKLAIQMSKMLEEEGKLGRDFPLLINTDLQVTDQALNVLSGSLWRYQNLDPEGMCDLRHVLAQNHFTGCTFLMNRALINSSLPVSDMAIMHDWWLALVAAAKGAIISINESTVLYRQHGENEIGAKRWSLSFVLKAVFSGTGKYKGVFERSRAQAEAFYNSGLIDKTSKTVAEKYVKMFDESWFERRKTLVKEGFFKKGYIRNLAMFIYI